ncbi:proline-rich protein 23D1-like [Saimiri boliviensis]|uniref:Proline rich 23C n=1 Tax=Saimiri boliviensis boliviensis TaxID=39432 RepID=A0A2K6TJ96_SAIBB|nr:proline-rich protein 23D1-like [Saimiri boliviensis boliviensis]
MYGYRCPRSPSDFWTELQSDSQGESSLAATQMNPPKRRRVEQHPGTGAETPSVLEAPHQDSCQSLEPSQVQQDSSTEEFIVILEEETEVTLILEEGIIILAPETALQLTVDNTALVIVPEQDLRSPDSLQSPVQIQYILPSVDDFTVEIHDEDGDISDMRRENAPLAPAEEGEAAPLYHQPLMMPPANHMAGISPSFLVTPLCIPRRLAAFPQRYPLPPTPSPVRRSKPDDYIFSLHGMELLCTSSLRPMPPSPSPGPQIYHRIHHRRPRKARRCLFRE